jgi:hypothetical protein
MLIDKDASCGDKTEASVFAAKGIGHGKNKRSPLSGLYDPCQLQQLPLQSQDVDRPKLIRTYKRRKTWVPLKYTEN